MHNAPVELPLAGPFSPVAPPRPFWPPSPRASPGSPFPHFITVNESEMTSEKKKLHIERKKNCEKEKKRSKHVALDFSADFFILFLHFC
jgi:hypothetical protein